MIHHRLSKFSFYPRVFSKTSLPLFSPPPTAFSHDLPMHDHVCMGDQCPSACILPSMLLLRFHFLHEWAVLTFDFFLSFSPISTAAVYSSLYLSHAAPFLLRGYRGAGIMASLLSRKPFFVNVSRFGRLVPCAGWGCRDPFSLCSRSPLSFAFVSCSGLLTLPSRVATLAV